ncbi:MAG: PDZ domain-containing protein [Armatimonadetes bacterium]|nr:PDZ domain-containing protein [Armatimonadota bacterium]
MAVKQNVSGTVVVVVLVLALVLAYALFFRAELAPPGVDVMDHGEEEEPVLPQSPEATEQEFNNLSKGLMPLGAIAVFPPLAEDRYKGARIAAVGAGTPAAVAGLQPGDLVTRFGDFEIGNPFSLVGVLNTVTPDQSYEMVVIRSREEVTLVISGITPLPLEEQVR